MHNIHTHRYTNTHRYATQIHTETQTGDTRKHQKERDAYTQNTQSAQIDTDN